MEDIFRTEPGHHPAAGQALQYSEQAVWLCENRKTRFKTRINGALAEILKQYPQDYKLRLISIKPDSAGSKTQVSSEVRKDGPHEHAAATGK